MELARRSPRARTAAAVVGVTLVLGGVLGPTPAGAAPGDAATAAEAAQRTAQELTVIDEQLHEAKLTVAELQADARAAEQSAAKARARLTALEPQLRAIAQSGYTGRTQSKIAAFLTSESADALVSQMTTLDVIASHTEKVVAAAAAAKDAAEKAEGAASAAAQTAAAGLAELAEQQQAVERRRDEYEATFARLSVQEQAAVTTAVAGPSLEAPSAEEAVAAAPNAAAATVVETALAQVGDAYVWGAAGPDSYDCSGLTMFAYAAAGVSLPHSSRAQAAMGRPVSRAELQPGDLVFFYSPISHVAIYVGGGTIVHARTFGQPVNVTSVDMAGYAGAVRILG